MISTSLILKNASIYESSPLQRWEDAVDKIRYIEENRDKFKKLCIYPIGKVGAQVGNWLKNFMINQTKKLVHKLILIFDLFEPY